MLCGCGAKEGIERAAKWAGAEQAMREEGKEGKALAGPPAGQAREGEEEKAGPVPELG